MKSRLVVGLDVGSYAVKGIAAAMTEKGPQIVATGYSLSSGVRRGIVVDIEEVVKSIKEVINFLSQSSGQRIKEVYAAISGAHLALRPSRGVVAVALANGEITGEDILRVIHAARTISLPSNREILQVIPKEYFIDGEGGIREPLGMYGVRLEVDAFIVDGSSSFVKNFRKVIELSGLDPSSLVVNPLATARAVLNKRQKELGTAVVDIGAGTTTLTVFEEGDLFYFQIFPVGSSHITNDLAIKFKTSVEVAEKFKQEYGTCLSKSVGKKELINLSSLGDEGRGVYARKDAADSIESRMTEILQGVQKELKKIGKASLLPGGVILCGGGAKIAGIEELARKIFKLPVQMANSEETKSKDMDFMTALGAMMWGMDVHNLEEGGTARGFGRVKKIFRFFLP